MWSLTYILQSMGLTVICVALLTQVFCRLNWTELTNIHYSSSGNLAEVVQTNWVGTPLTQSPHSVSSLKDLNWIMMACACCLKSIWLHSLTFNLGLTSWGKNLTKKLCQPIFFYLQQNWDLECKRGLLWTPDCYPVYWKAMVSESPKWGRWLTYPRHGTAK